MLDLWLAIAHHLLIFALFGVLAAEVVLVRPGLSAQMAARIASIDTWYGISAGGIIVVGFSRAIFAAKGWADYSHNAFFWAKIGTFVLIALLSIPPTIAFIRWRAAGTGPSTEQIAGIRRLLLIEVVLFALLPAFAAAMARGYGEF